MANIFAISPLNSLRWVHQIPRDARYNTASLDTRRDERCYRIKRQTNDNEPEQFLSSYPDIAIKFYTIDGLFYKDIAVSQVDINIIDPTFEAYECDIDYSEFDEGEYFAQLTYTGDLGAVQTWQTAPISVADYWPDTLLFEYFNSNNKNNVIFDTGIVFNQRVEAYLLNFDPSFNYNGFVDQEYDTTQLSSLTYRLFALQLGNAHMLPDYMMDKANELMNVDNIKIDGTYYQKQVGDAKWQMSRVDGNPDSYGTIAIAQTDKPVEYNLDTGGDIDSNIIVVQNNEQYYNISGAITIANKFKKYSHLTRIVIFNKGGTSFDLKVGTVAGASDIALFPIDAGDITDSLSISRAFNLPTTVYVTPTGTALYDFFVDWKQYDKAPVNINGNTPPPQYSLGFAGEYIEVNDGDFELHWNIGTGLGMPNTPYENCALRDGRNGTVDDRGLFNIGYDYTNPSQRDALTGLVGNVVTLTVNNLPPHSHTTDMYPNKAGAGGSIGGQGPNNTGGSSTANTGGGQSFDITPRSRITVKFSCIQ